MERQCTAHRKNGNQCGRAAIRGGTVCIMHGGSAPQVKRAAKERLDELVDPAITELNRIMLETDSDAVKLQAIKEVLDRAMGRPQQHVDVTSDGQPLFKAYEAVDADRV